jgi:hypothetical protein
VTFVRLSQDAGTWPLPAHMPHAALGDHWRGTFSFRGHSKCPRPPHPGQGTIASAGFRLLGIPSISPPLLIERPIYARRLRTVQMQGGAPEAE